MPQKTPKTLMMMVYSWQEYATRWLPTGNPTSESMTNCNFLRQIEIYKSIEHPMLQPKHQNNAFKKDTTLAQQCLHPTARAHVEGEGWEVGVVAVWFSSCHPGGCLV